MAVAPLVQLLLAPTGVRVQGRKGDLVVAPLVQLPGYLRTQRIENPVQFRFPQFHAIVSTAVAPLVQLLWDECKGRKIRP